MLHIPGLKHNVPSQFSVNVLETLVNYNLASPRFLWSHSGTGSLYFLRNRKKHRKAALEQGLVLLAHSNKQSEVRFTETVTFSRFYVDYFHILAWGCWETFCYSIISLIVERGHLFRLKIEVVGTLEL